MRTLSEYEAARTAQREKDDAKRREHLTTWLAAVEKAAPPLWKLGFEHRRSELRALVRDGNTSTVAVACDHCGTQLISIGMMSGLRTTRRQVACIGCGWLGEMST